MSLVAGPELILTSSAMFQLLNGSAWSMKGHSTAWKSVLLNTSASDLLVNENHYLRVRDIELFLRVTERKQHAILAKSVEAQTARW